MTYLEATMYLTMLSDVVRSNDDVISKKVAEAVDLAKNLLYSASLRQYTQNLMDALSKGKDDGED